ncbi:MAG: thio(seleno)oxazole modification radical SAM maturase SbtM [Candidatus Methylomirabilia bacterium]
MISRNVHDAPGFAADLASARAAAAAAAAGSPARWSAGAGREINPSLQVLRLSWRHLGPHAVTAAPAAGTRQPEPGEEILLVWQSPWHGRTIARAAEADDLLALKLVVEAIPLCEAATAGSLSEGDLENVLARAAGAGIILAPRPLISRADDFPRGEVTDESFFTSAGFTLQWHLTQSCDLHCRHCYDRSARAAVSLPDALRVLEDLESFCRARRVSGHVSLSGGNPLLHPQFTEIYRAAAGPGGGLAILGNPAPRERIEELVAIRRPGFYQVSFEGLPEHNDWVRGPGHFERTAAFLEVLKELGVSTMVMLTLTADNIDQVLPLTERLRGLVDDFHFNRLAMVGEGANLRLPTRERYARFLAEYLAAAEANPALGIKDNLINILRRGRGEVPFGGCTGFGCGAAFNFLALLPDGEAHACRKFPSPIGNVVRDGLAKVYDSEAARRYRGGCSACRDCAIRPVCGGCLAVAHGFGLDPLRERDPLCFLAGA